MAMLVVARPRAARRLIAAGTAASAIVLLTVVLIVGTDGRARAAQPMRRGRVRAL